MVRVAAVPLYAKHQQAVGSVKDRVKAYDHYDIAVQKLNKVDHLTPKDIANKVIDYSTKTLEVSDLLIRTTANTVRAVEEFFKESRFVADAVAFLRPILKVAKTIGIALAPLYLYQFGKGVYDYSKHTINLGDLLLNSFQSLALCTDSIVSFLQDLVVLGKLPLEMLKYLWPFDVIGLVLSTISLISHARGWHRSANFVKEFEKLMDFHKDASDLTNEDINAVVDFIMRQDKKRIEKIFEMSKSELVEKVEIVAKRAKLMNKDSVPTNDKMAAQEEFKNAMSSLRGRVKSKIVSHQLGVTSSSISLVANSILFVTPFVMPAFPGIVSIMPALYTLKSAGGIISFSNFLYKAITKYQFSHADFMKEKTKAIDSGDIELEDIKAETSAEDLQKEKAK